MDYLIHSMPKLFPIQSLMIYALYGEISKGISVNDNPNLTIDG